MKSARNVIHLLTAQEPARVDVAAGAQRLPHAVSAQVSPTGHGSSHFCCLPDGPRLPRLHSSCTVICYSDGQGLLTPRFDDK